MRKALIPHRKVGGGLTIQAVYARSCPVKVTFVTPCVPLLTIKAFLGRICVGSRKRMS